MNHLIRPDQEILDLIMGFAINDDRIRIVMLNGSRIDPNATRDCLNDFDIIYFVRDIKSFLVNKSWIENSFGEILILQEPDDWYSHPYDYEGNEPFAFLIQFVDGNRIDLTLVDVENSTKYKNLNTREPGRILLQKEELKGVSSLLSFDKFEIKAPSEKEFSDTCNEFFWLAPYIGKGLFRKELIYVKSMMENYQFEQLYKMLSWHVLIREDHPIRIGNFSKYLPRYLSTNENEELSNCFSGSDINDIWKNEIKVIKLFTRHAAFVSDHFHFNFDIQISKKIIEFLNSIRNL